MLLEAERRGGGLLRGKQGLSHWAMAPPRSVAPSPASGPQSSSVSRGHASRLWLSGASEVFRVARHRILPCRVEVPGPLCATWLLCL